MSVFSKMRKRKRLLDEWRDDINIELTTLCNLRCRMCPHEDLSKDEIGHMDFELFQHVVDGMAEIMGPKTVFRLMGLGEPLMYPHLGDAIRYVRQKYESVTIRLSTNGIALNEEHTKELLDSSLDRLLVSLNAWDADTYEWLMGARKFETVVDNVQHFLAFRNDNGSFRQYGRPRLTVQLMVADKTSKDEHEFRKFWETHLDSRDDVIIRPMVNWADQIDTDQFGVSSKTEARFPCLSLWNTVAVNKDGDVYPCCMAFSTRKQSELVLGNASHASMKEMFHGSRLEECKKAHMMGDWSFASDCAGCDAYRGYPNIWFNTHRIPLMEKRWS